MTQLILGPEGSNRRWRLRFLVVPTLLAAAVALMLAGGAQAVHDLKFELDRNVTTEGTTPFGSGTFDWDSFFNASGSSSPGLPAPSRPGFTNSALTRDFATNPDGSFVTSDTT